MYVLSPYVWREDGGYSLLLRAVPRRDDAPRLKISEIWSGRSSDGRCFAMDVEPRLFPEPGRPDRDGCEDPTVCRDGDAIHVWYTGYEAATQTGRLLAASGPAVSRLAKAGVAIDSRAPFANPKEASLARVEGDGWRMFFEYAADGLSAIGIARSASLDGPWEVIGQAPLGLRAGRWDSGHMSPGPFIRAGGEHPIMFYNGGGGDATWRIGWAMFDRTLTRVVARCEEPLIAPDDLPAPDARDMAFVASAIEEGEGSVLLYYTVADMEPRFAELKIDGA